MRIFDTHAHYCDEAFDADRAEVLAAMQANGIERIAEVGTSVEISKQAVDLAAEYDFIYATVGIHPETVNSEQLTVNSLDELRELAKAPKVVAIGEIGLDYHYEGYDKASQSQWFTAQLELARELKLPVCVHSRDAAEDTFRLLEPFGDLKIMLHCFSGSVETAKIAALRGYYISIGGVLTFKNAKTLPEVAAVYPRERVLLETDCPYLSPTPLRGSRNSSLNLPLIAEKLAEIWNVSPGEAAETTYANGNRFYNL
ncbi:MAG: TatD family hydrolase [Oscillospiraceae bacterium]|jgi:TatD DNase family protein|nr:TatD family hydrolase [Oscillospiraceae bacterium]